MLNNNIPYLVISLFIIYYYVSIIIKYLQKVLIKSTDVIYDTYLIISRKLM